MSEPEDDYEAELLARLAGLDERPPEVVAKDSWWLQVGVADPF